MKNSSKILIALGAGIAVGGVLGLLFAPDKGVETRTKIAQKGKEFKEELSKRLKAVHEKQEEKVNGTIPL
jgi:gas vesicle protein